jgi:hypothetical protein
MEPHAKLFMQISSSKETLLTASYMRLIAAATSGFACPPSSGAGHLMSLDANQEHEQALGP